MWSSRPPVMPSPAATMSVLRATVASRSGLESGSVVLRKDPNVGTPRWNPARDGVRRERISPGRTSARSSRHLPAGNSGYPAASGGVGHRRVCLERAGHVDGDPVGARRRGSGDRAPGRRRPGLDRHRRGAGDDVDVGGRRDLGGVDGRVPDGPPTGGGGDPDQRERAVADHRLARRRLVRAARGGRRSFPPRSSVDAPGSAAVGGSAGWARGLRRRRSRRGRE